MVTVGSATSSPSPSVPLGPASITVTSTPARPGSEAPCDPSPSTSKYTVSPSDPPVVVIDAVSWSSSAGFWLSGVESGSGAPEAVTSAVLSCAPGAITSAVMVSVSDAPDAKTGMVQTPVPGTYAPAVGLSDT